MTPYEALMAGPPMVPIRTTPQGWTIARIHYSIIPDYDYDATIEGMSEEGIRAEMEIDWTASAHKRVFPGFGQIHQSASPIKPNPRLPFYLGWDFGGTPAMVPSQINHYGQWVLWEAQVGPPDRAVDTWDFGFDVRERLDRDFARPFGLTVDDLEIHHFGDPAGRARPPRTSGRQNDAVKVKSDWDILRSGIELIVGWRGEEPIVEKRPGFGWKMKAGAIAIPTRLAAVRNRLAMLRNGQPLVIVDSAATTLIEAFSGGYHYKARPDGSYDLDPEKNWYSHPMDCVQYIATGLWAAAPEPPDEEEDAPREETFRSAAGRRDYR